MSANKKDLLLLFERPQEPVFMKKGEDNAVFDVPEKFLTKRHQSIGPGLLERLSEDAGRRIQVKDIDLPDLTEQMSLGRYEQFSLFIPFHRALAGSLIDIFMGAKSIEELLSIAVYSRDRLNPYLFNYAFSVALMHRPDTKYLKIPSLAEIFPEKFIASKAFARIREELAVIPESSRTPVVVPHNFTISDREEEHRLWYFREDMGANLHHWHWHLIYPFETNSREIVRKDRRGEIFYFMHQQIVARYNMERFSNDLPRAKTFSNLREPIVEGYFPKINALLSNQAAPPRLPGTQLQDIDIPVEQLRVDISNLELWRDRFLEVIDKGYFIDEYENKFPLDDVTGIDYLGNIMESSIISPNRRYYGDLHNMGHVCISYSHDPQHLHLESFSVMADSATAMRDPSFYRWHSHIDDLFEYYKAKLPKYNEQQLGYKGIIVNDILVETPNEAPNTLHTFWQQSDINIGRGVDFAPRSGEIFARITHLQHHPFTYTFKVTNNNDLVKFGTVRVYLGPKYDENSKKMKFNENRRFMCEMDRFKVQLHPGENTIKRRSNESDLTTNFENTFRNLSEARSGDGGPEELEENFCGCGWPDHLLVPKGNEKGFQCELFVFISNYDDDKIEQDLVGQCTTATVFCGLRDRKYPDKRPMGFPFDRPANENVETFDDFLLSNMKMEDVKIFHKNVITSRPETKKKDKNI
ncbi:phenoloxidase 2-like [Condylostylus longicornis]|uniref:phenoloxidase 2-like n=1 Tax=Condylostylus longicornis TaxID=2530218 RepID=UPI00244DC087|nr:phenoloxidase 2-like [Condylostylus longicornis]